MLILLKITITRKDKIKMDEQALLNLSTYTDDEQLKWLIENDIIQPLLEMRDETVIENIKFESIPDCAFRLKQTYKRHCFRYWSCMIKVWQHVNDTKQYPDSPEALELFYEWWVFDALPINWIQAIILMKIELE
jgi:hypothetical protein